MKYVFNDSIEDVSICTLDLQEPIPISVGAFVVLPFRLALLNNSIVECNTHYKIVKVCIDIVASCVFVWVCEVSKINN